MGLKKRCPVCGEKRLERPDWADESKWVQPAKANRKAMTTRFFECAHCSFEIAVALSGKQRKKGKKLWKALFKSIAEACA